MTSNGDSALDDAQDRQEAEKAKLQQQRDEADKKLEKERIAQQRSKFGGGFASKKDEPVAPKPGGLGGNQSIFGGVDPVFGGGDAVSGGTSAVSATKRKLNGNRSKLLGG